MRNKSKEINISYSPRFSPEALIQLQSYNWPGNVRELQNVIERALIISKGQPISFPHLSETDSLLEPSDSTDPGKTRFPTMNEIMIQHIIKSLELSNGKVDGPGGAAELLGMNPSTLRGRMRKFGIRTKRTLTYPE